ncbi:MAG TPA: SDR family NAD(P)-dependent oxidoreductase, partial [Xanthobacteraceae bacterium]|nr:SDR family NAD(P)-dependent oxidoreductase [Xanthobacteraceae bacterium]
MLITGGAEGIGRGLAARFAAAGARVLVTGRSREKLERAASELRVETLVNDLSRAAEREALARHMSEVMPGLNVLINNAGIQRRVSLASDTAPWDERQVEIDTLLSAPVHLNHLLVPGMLAHGRSSLIVNVTSGGAYIPQPFAPIYSACKAALHSYTMNLRFALAG